MGVAWAQEYSEDYLAHPNAASANSRLKLHAQRPDNRVLVRTGGCRRRKGVGNGTGIR